MVMLSTVEQEKKALTPSKDKVPEPSEVKPATEKGKESPDDETLVEKMGAELGRGISSTQLRALLPSLPGNAQEKVSAVVEALFGGVEKGFGKEFGKKKSYLAAVTSQDEGSEMLLLGAIEEFCGKSSGALKEVALILKALYDGDVLEEEHILQWYNDGLKGTNKSSPVWKNVKPFAEWLQNAESESEEE